MEVLERLTPYVELVHLLLNTNFTYLTRKLAPSDSLDRARIPSAVAKSYDEVLFGGVLFDCVPGIPCEIKTPFGICFTALALWKGDGFVLIGPYLPERADGAQLEEILASQGVPLGLKEQYGIYYRDLPTLSRGKVRAALGVLAAGVYGESLASSAFSSRDISPEDPSPCPVFEEDSMQVRADAIARRYEGERRLMEAVARGDMRAADMVEETTLRLERVPNKLRNRKNLFIVLNTLMRKAVEAAQVHPFYIDAISAKWAMRIEAVEQEADLYPMRREIVEDYCRLAQTRSMASYSPNVRSMLTYVQFNLAEGISLEAIARQLGVNASYLSSQFNREVGKSLPEYVSEKRIAEAKRLLRGRAQLPIGQIAAAVGFSDVNYFTKVFKKKAGQTPSAYRAAQRALAAEQKEI